MSGRQSHGRPVTAKPVGKAAKKSNSKANKNHRARALDAYTLAAAELPDEKAAPRHRNPDIDAAPRPKHARELSEEEEDLEIEGPRRKKPRPTRPGKKEDSDVEYGSDEEGNRWRIGGPANDEDDSEIDSDEAFGESDHDNFEGFAFRGSKSKEAEVCGSVHVGWGCGMRRI